MSIFVAVVTFAVALLVTLLCVPLVSKLAFHLDAVDYPSARRVNKKPVPRMGGVAMFVGMAAAFLVLIVGIHCFGWESPLNQELREDINFVGVAVGVVLIFIVGVIDDIVELRARVKFIGQIIAACIVAGSGLLLASVHNPFGGYIEFGIFAYPLTVFYLVAFANVINLIDGLDGLAAGITAISAGTILILSVVTNSEFAALLSLILLGICLGFLKYNFNPASIFMGDSGSLLLGFMLAIISLFATARTAALVSLLVPVVAAGVPIMDTASAIIRRTRAHKSIGEPDKGHIHHRLLESGYSQKTTVYFMWGLTALFAFCALVFMKFDGVVRLVCITVAVIAAAVVIFKLHLLDPVLIHHFAPRGRKNGSGGVAAGTHFKQSDEEDQDWEVAGERAWEGRIRNEKKDS